jgi:hypothetical protein
VKFARDEVAVASVDFSVGHAGNTDESGQKNLAESIGRAGRQMRGIAKCERPSAANKRKKRER